jgi:hypothetical protein
MRDLAHKECFFLGGYLLGLKHHSKGKFIPIYWANLLYIFNFCQPKDKILDPISVGMRGRTNLSEDVPL